MQIMKMEYASLVNILKEQIGGTIANAVTCLDTLIALAVSEIPVSSVYSYQSASYLPKDAGHIRGMSH